MKRVLLTFTLLLCLSQSRAQIALNELFTVRANCASAAQYFEIYNGSGSSVSLDGYALVAWYKSGSETGFYVVDFPANTTINSTTAFVVAGMAPNQTSFCYGGGSNNPTLTYSPQLNWTGITKKYIRNGSAYTPVAITTQQDIFFNTGTGSGSTGFTYNAFLFGVVGGAAKLINGVFGGYSSGQTPSTFPTELSSMPVITGAISLNGQLYDVSFGGLIKTSAEYVTANTGSGNGYIRTNDGQCGSWKKSASPGEHTPGTTSTTNSTAFYYITATGLPVGCNNSTEPTSITAKFNYPTGEQPYPIEYYVIWDKNSDGNIDPDGVDAWSTQYIKSDNSNNDQVTVTGLNWGETYFIYAKSQQGCFFATYMVEVPNCAIMPVLFNSFKAVRNKNNVSLTWETASEQNNRGFYIQRNTKGVWENIAWVFSAADGGNSSDLLQYVYKDVNNERGVSQYRIQQVDLDGKASYSVIRSVKGEEQAAKTLVYPNPSMDGKVAVVFEDQSPKAVTVSDISGRVVRQYRNVLNNLQIEGLENGLYSIQVTDLSSAVSTTEKVIIKKR